MRRLVQLHGGTVAAFSAGTGLGSEFTLDLPASDAMARQAPPPARPAGATTDRPLNILVVDDNFDAAETIGALLTVRGHAVEICFSPEQALSRVENFRPDVAILDIGLPGMSGHVLARQLQTILGHNTCRLIAQTGYGQPADIARSNDAGFDIHLIKPVDPARLLAIVEQPALAAG